MTAAPVDLDRSGIGGHPRGLSTLFFTEMWERFSYYGMRALLLLFMVAPVAKGGLGFETPVAAGIYGLYTGSVYFTAIPGGWIADRLLGLRRAVLVGGVLIALGHYCLAVHAVPSFFVGLGLIIAGTGLLKPNISSIVGELYGEDDPRRDSGFSIFYMGINLGAFISPLVCGYLGQKIGWHWGFGAAGVGMTLGVFQYVLGAGRLGRAGLPQGPLGGGVLWAKVIAAVVGLCGGLYLLWDRRDVVVLVGTAVLFAWLLRQAAPGVERKRIGAIIVLFVFATLFWAGFEQAGSSLNLFADQRTRNTLFGWDFPSSWYQSVQPLFIILLAPAFAWLWLKLGRFEPSSPAKFAYGLLFVGLGFLVVAVGAWLQAREGGALVSPMWLILVYLLHTLGELSLSPVGLSTVTKLAPPRMVGLMMGVWFLALSLGNFIGGGIAGFFGRFPLPELFGAVFLTTAASALVLAMLVKPIRGLMAGVH